MKTLFKNGQTSVIVRVMIMDTTSSVGAGLTGVVFNSPGLNISTIADNESAATVYSTAGSTIETITTIGTFAPPTATKCRFKAVDATNHPGLYEIQIADARWAVSNAKSLIVHITGVVNGYSAPAEVQLSAIDVNDATAAGISRIDEAVSAAKNVKAGGIARAAFATDTGLQCIRSGTAQSGSISTIQYDAGASAANNFSIGCWVYITSGTGVGQVRMVQSYANVSKTATVSPNWDTAPDATSVFAILPAANIRAVDTAPSDSSGVTTLLTRIASALTITGGKVDVNDKTGFSLSAAGIQASWDALTANLTTVGSVGKYIVNNLSTYAGGDTAGTTTLLSRLTAPRATNLDNLDAAVSSRSTYAGGDTAGTTTLLSRIASALTITGGKVDVNDKTGFALSPAGIQAVWDALTANLTTVGSIGKYIINNLSTYAGGDSSGVTTLLARLTAPRATNLDNLDTTVSSRSTYAGADTAGTTTLLSRLTATRASNLDFLDSAISGVKDAVWTVASRTLTAFGFTVNTNANATETAIKTVTDKFRFTIANQVDSNALTGGGGATAAEIWAYANRELTAFNFGLPSVTILSPVLDGGDIEMYAGYDYTVASGFPLLWDFVNAIDLTGATIDVVHIDTGETTYGWTISLLNPGATTQTVRAEVNATQTAALGFPGNVLRRRFRIKATLPDLSEVVLLNARMTIR